MVAAEVGQLELEHRYLAPAPPLFQHSLALSINSATLHDSCSKYILCRWMDTICANHHFVVALWNINCLGNTIGKNIVITSQIKNKT